MIKVGISQGDINGIGWEIILKTFSDPTMLELCTPIIFGSNKTCSYHRKALNIEEFNFQIIRDADQAQAKKVNVLNVYDEEVSIELGKATPLGGRYALMALEAATKAVVEKKIDVLVTAPINKHTIQSADFKFAGHTEYLQQKSETGESLMLMCADALRVGLVTGHVPVTVIAQNISTDKIIAKIKLLNKTLITDFGVRKPRIAVLGLNPHAGDGGTLGSEEQNVITPAIVKVKEEGIMVYGPYPADGFFGSGNHLKFDAILAMYHDQGLVPFKALSFGEGVNFTAGLSFVRTSPDHGTGFDIAGKNMASPDSFRKAIYMAIDVFRKRNEYKQIAANPLQVTQLKKERG
jgi:4-hydroxythreonine-4-phosphate dehydrogenase